MNDIQQTFVFERTLTQSSSHLGRRPVSGLVRLLAGDSDGETPIEIHLLDAQLGATC